MAVVLALHGLFLWLPWPLPSSSVVPRTVRVALASPARVVNPPAPLRTESAVRPASAPASSRTPIPAPTAVVSIRPAAESGQPPAPAMTDTPAVASVTPESTPTAMPTVAPLPVAAPVIAEASVICTERPAASYPPLSRKLGEQGRTIVRFGVDEAGRIASAEIRVSSGSPRLDRAALSAVGAYRCRPARRDNVPVAAMVSQTFDFVLEPALHP